MIIASLWTSYELVHGRGLKHQRRVHFWTSVWRRKWILHPWKTKSEAACSWQGLLYGQLHGRGQRRCEGSAGAVSKAFLVPRPRSPPLNSELIVIRWDHGRICQGSGVSNPFFFLFPQPGCQLPANIRLGLCCEREMGVDCRCRLGPGTNKMLSLCLEERQIF